MLTYIYVDNKSFEVAAHLIIVMLNSIENGSGVKNTKIASSNQKN